MELFTDFFKPQTEKEFEEAQAKATEQVDIAGDLARHCLAMEDFQKYKRQYELAQEKMISAMEMCTKSYMSGDFDITTYGAKMLVFMTRIKDLRMLLDTVTYNAKKGKKNERSKE